MIKIHFITRSLKQIMTSPAYVLERLQCMSITKISLFLKVE